jgi:RNA polymerase sigma factor (TIGR02999 family)
MASKTKEKCGRSRVAAHFHKQDELRPLFLPRLRHLRCGFAEINLCDMSAVTQLLDAAAAGDPQAAADLLPLVYDELRKLAAARVIRENPCQTLQATVLVHEAYLRLVDVEKAQHWNSRGHFFAAAAEAMRRILVESARRKSRLKHGGEHQRVDLESDCLVSEAPSLDLLALDEALTRLAETEPAKVELVKLRFFAGLTMPEAAAAMDISLATAERYWTFAKSWLYAELADDA